MNRRTFVKTGVAATAGVSMLSLSGCSQLPLVGSGGSYTQWLHEPGEIGSADHYTVSVYKPETIFANEDRFDGDRVDDFEASYDQRLEATGVDADEVQQVIGTNASTVFTGGFQRPEIAEELEDGGYDDEDEVSGFTIYVTPDEQRAWAVSPNALIRTRSMGRYSAPDVAEEVIDVSNDEEDRYVDESEAMEILANNLDDGLAVFALTYDEINDDDPEQGDFDDSIGIGVSASLSGDAVTLKYVVAYDTSNDVDLDDLETWVDAQDDTGFDDVDDVSYDQSNRAGIITGETDADDVELFG